MQKSVLLIDQQSAEQEALRQALSAAGYLVHTVEGPLDSAWRKRTDQADAVVTGLRLSGGQDGIRVLRELKSRYPAKPVIVITAHSTVGSAVAAMQLGAADYLEKPFTPEELLLRLDRLCTAWPQSQPVHSSPPASLSEADLLLGASKPICAVRTCIHTVSENNSSVLIEGESGTGKEVVARLLHACGPRAAGPFVAVSCAALPETLIESELFGHEIGAFTGAVQRRRGRFELADKGTLFLDDIDDMPLTVQVKLLRALQDHAIERIGGSQAIPVDIRLVTATKHNLRTMVEAGSFREDLFYRIQVIPIFVPPLRERAGDIALLTNHFLTHYAERFGRDGMQLLPDAIHCLERHTWPGNVRELKHLMERVAALCPTLEVGAQALPPLHHCPQTGPVSLTLDHIDHLDLTATLAHCEREIIAWALERTDGNLSQAATLLRLPRTTLQHRWERLRKV